MGELEINCLHSLEGLVADKLSKRVIKGVSYTSLQGAKMMVQAGVAKQSDFYVCVGYSGWAPGQLQMEVDKRDSWYLASADSGTLLKELLKQSEELPPTSLLLVHAGRALECGRSLGALRRGRASWRALDGRRMSRQAKAALMTGCSASGSACTYCRGPRRQRRQARCLKACPSARCSAQSRAYDRTGVGPLLLRDQYLHKAIILIIEQREADGKWVGCVLNRPTATVVEFNTPGKPRRRLPFCRR